MTRAAEIQWGPPPTPTDEEARSFMRQSMLAMVEAGFDDGDLIDSVIDYEGKGREVLVVTMKFRHKTAGAA